MSATLDDGIERTFSEQLDEFDGKLREQEDNAELLKDIHTAITALLSETGEREADIREILQKRYNGGKLRLETYQLVRNVLDRVVIESMATMPEAVDEPTGDDVFSRTTVIESRTKDDETSQDRLQVGSVLRDRFLLQERVSGGSMGVVYKALDRRIAEADGVDPWVAIKVLSQKLSRNGHALRALQQEAAKGRCLSHPNIVRFIDLDRDDDIYFIVMEWLEGRSLAAILDEKRNEGVDLATTLDIVRQVGLALDYAHRCGVVHADVKPANVMISPSGQVKLLDFGIARIRQKQPRNNRDFDPGVLGAVTPAYSSMQVLTGEDPQPADDVFSLGCLMYRLVAGHRVFGPRNAAEAAEQGMEPQRPHGVSDVQWRALKKSLAWSRVSRFSTPAQFLAALEADEERHVGIDEPILVAPKPFEREPRRPWGIVAVLLLVAAGVAALVLRPELFQSLRSAGDSAVDRARTMADRPAREPATEPADGAVVAEDPFEQTAEPGDARSTGDAAGSADTGLDDAALSSSEPEPAAPQGGGETDGAALPDVPQGEPVPIDEAGRPVTEGSGVADEAARAEQRLPPLDDAGAGTVPPAAGEAAPPTLTVPLALAGSARAEFDLILREDANEATVELVRESGLQEPLAVLVEEVGFSGNRSPLTNGRYRLSNHMARFEAGEATAHFTISMSSDDVREADQQATLLLRNAENAASRLAVVNLTLQDDDQRTFESNLALDTIGFSESRIFVDERSPAVQIDVLRLNPGDAELDVRYTISGGSATEGEDFFIPGATGLVFGPGQRSARLLIPIVQDALAEGDETFTLELLTGSAATPANVNREITVVIGDDDSF
jgi:serine/threonine protein kinase